ncbi:MAG: rod shape-determining protein MreC [Patescibacteria group bacterium]
MNRNKKITFLFISLIILLTIFLHSCGCLNFFENFIKKVVFSTSHFFYKQNISIETKELKDLDKDTLITKINEMAEQKLNLENFKSQNQMLIGENEELKKQLNFLRNNNYQTIGAEVISRAVDPLGTTLIINVGEKNGVQIDNPVIVGEGILIGKIIKIEEKESTVRLITDNNSKIGATILNQSKSLGLVEGGYGLGVKMDFIPQNENINIGDTIVTSGLTEGIPRGLLIGKVEIVEKEPHEPFQQAILKTSADLSYLTVVSVIIRAE